MIYYVILFLIIFLNYCIKSKKKYCWVVGAILVLFAGLRANIIGQDTPQYQYIYEEFIKYGYEDLLRLRGGSDDSEIGYFILQAILSHFVNYNVFKFICSALTIIPACFVIYKYSKKPYISFFVFFALPIFTLLSMCAMRQGIAFGMCMFAFHFAVTRRLKYFLLCIVGATLFHVSSIFFLPIYLINSLKYRRKHNWWIIAIMVLVGITSSSIFIFLAQYSRMQYEIGDAGGVKMLLFLLGLYLVSFFIQTEKLRDNINKFNFYLLVYTILLWLIGMNLAAVFRLAAYTEFFLCLYISNTITEIYKVQIRKVALTTIYIVCFLIMQTLVLRGKSEVIQYPYNPYYFVWEKTK